MTYLTALQTDGELQAPRDADALAAGETGPRGQVAGGVGFATAEDHLEGILLDEFPVVGERRPGDGEEDLRCVSVKDVDDF